MSQVKRAGGTIAAEYSLFSQLKNHLSNR